MRARRRRRQRRALPDQPCRMIIPASSGRRPLGSSWPLKSDCPLECVRACRVCTGCRRDVDQARRQIGIDVWIDGKTVRASRAHVPDHLCRCSHSLTAATGGGPAGPSCGPAGRPRSSLPPLGVPGPSGRYLEGRIPRASEGARPPQCLELGAREPIMPALTRCSRLSSAGTTALGGRYGHGRGREERRRTRRCGRRARSAPGAGGGRWDGRARAQSACSGTSIRATGRARAAQVGAVASGAPGSSGPAPGRSGSARVWSLAVPRPERASGACLRASRGRLRAECACAKKKV